MTMFPVDVPTEGVSVDCHDSFDIYRPDAADGPLPAVIFVPGPFPRSLPFRPRQRPFFQSYARLACANRFVGVTVDVPEWYWPPEDPDMWREPADQLARIVADVRKQPEVDADRVALWAFSGGALLVSDWLRERPEWLRCVALSYPVLYVPTEPPGLPYAGLATDCPVVLTRVGKEEPGYLAAVDDLVPECGNLRQIDVPDGRHGFDALDFTDESAAAVTAAMGAVADLL
jgi:hypothetical protein